MSLTLFMHGGTVSAAVQVPAPISFERVAVNTRVYSGVKFDADGDVYARDGTTGGWNKEATWLLAGTVGSYYLSRTIDSGLLTTDAGAGPLVMSTDRIYDRQVAGGILTVNATVTFDISSDVSGSPIVATGTYFFEATRAESEVSAGRVTSNWQRNQSEK